MENLEIIHRQKCVTKLTNTITDCMIENHMPMEYLELALDKVKHAYKTEARILTNDEKDWLLEKERATNATQ